MDYECDDQSTLTTSEFIEELFCLIPEGYAEVRCLHVSSDHRLTRRMWRSMPVKAVSQKGLDTLAALNEDGYHIYLRMGISSERNARKVNIISIPALWIDIDEPGESGFQKARAFEAWPNIVVSTGGGWHSYWLLAEPIHIVDDASRESVERTIEGMLLTCGGDRHVKDITRILRLPGTINVKPERNRARCEVVEYLPGRYHFEDLEELYAPLGAPAPLKVTRYIPPEAFSTELPKYVHDYILSGASVGERNQRLFVCARAYNDAGYPESQAERELLPRAQADGLTQSEALTAIRSGYRYNPNPQMPAHMVQRMAAADHLLRQKGA